MKKCVDCGEEYPNTIEYFKPYKRGYLRSQCRKCWNLIKSKRARSYYEEWMLKLIPKYLGVEKLTCIKCGYNKHPEVVEFHHVDPSKKEDALHLLVRQVSPWGDNTDKVYSEIDKCVVLCPNCHREHHMVGEWNERYKETL